MRQSMTTFFCLERHSPILRIGVVAGCVALSAACSKLGGDRIPTRRHRRRPPGSTIVYTAIGASDANGVGSSVLCVPFTECPNGMGYVPVTVRQLRAQGFTVNHLNLGVPTAVIGRDFQSSPAVQPFRRRQLHRAGDAVRPDDGDGRHDLRRHQRSELVTAALGGGAGGSDPNGYMDAQVQAFGTDYATLLAGIKTRAGRAAHRRAERAERGGAAVSRPRLAGAAAGGAAHLRRR